MKQLAKDLKRVRQLIGEARGKEYDVIMLIDKILIKIDKLEVEKEDDKKEQGT